MLTLRQWRSEFVTPNLHAACGERLAIGTAARDNLIVSVIVVSHLIARFRCMQVYGVACVANEIF